MPSRKFADRRISPWREDLQTLARFDNVYCKLSGMVTEAIWKGWRPDDFRGYLDIVIQAFGADRVMIGSDWPVCTLSGDYAAVMGSSWITRSSFPRKSAMLSWEGTVYDFTAFEVLREEKTMKSYGKWGLLTVVLVAGAFFSGEDLTAQADQADRHGCRH